LQGLFLHLKSIAGIKTVKMAKKTKSQKNKTLSKEDILTTPARKVLFDCLIKGLNLKQAAKQANITHQYARRLASGTENNIKALAMREIKAETVDLREKCTKVLVRIIDDEGAKHGERIKACDVLAKMSGWQSSTVNLETGTRQRELTGTEQAEARRLALLRFNALPAAITDTQRTSGVYEAEVCNNEDNNAEIDLEQAGNNVEFGQKNGGRGAEKDPIAPQTVEESLYPSPDRKFSRDIEGSDIGVFGDSLR